MSEGEVTVFQKIRDAAVRGKGIQLSADQARDLYRRSDEIREQADSDDMAALNGGVPVEADDEV